MSTQNVERELRAVLVRHAEDAMDSTDTQAERDRFYEVLEAEPRTDRRRLAVAVGAAAAAVTAVVVVSTVRGDDGTAPLPTNNPSTAQVEREAELLADRFMEAFVDRDAAAANALIRVGAWDDLEGELAFGAGWKVRYAPEPCTAAATSYDLLIVECPATVHSAGSEELGQGPFDDVVFSFVVRDGQVIDGHSDHNHETSGLGDYLKDVGDWITANASPAHKAFLDRDVSEVPEADLDRWVRLNNRYIDAYVEAHTGEGDG